MNKSSYSSFFLITILIMTIGYADLIHAQSATTVEIHIQNYRFSPNEVHIQIGDHVKFIWDTGADGHDVAQVSSDTSTKYDGKGFKSPYNNGPAEWELPAQYTSKNATLYYICEPHALSNGMRGKIIVGSGSEGQNSGIDTGVFWTVMLGLFVIGGMVFWLITKRSMKQTSE